MNIVFWVSVVVALAGLWLLLSPLFRDIGEYFAGLFLDAKDAMQEEDDYFETEDDEK